MIKNAMSKNIPPKILVAALLIYDIFVLNLSIFSALFLRFDGIVNLTYFNQYLSIAIYYNVIAFILFYSFGLYRRMWRFAGINELISIVECSLIASLSLFFLLFIYPGGGYSRGVMLINFFILTSLVGLPRFIFRYYYQCLVIKRNPAAPRTLIAGAGEAGQLALKELLRHQDLGMPVGFLDDDSSKIGLRVGRIKVEGKVEQLQKVAGRVRASRLIVAMPSAPVSVREQLVFQAKEMGLDVKILPGVYNILDSNTQVTQIRDIELEDLLERDPIDFNLETVRQSIKGKKVLVTGAGGSIGSEICRQAAGLNPSLLIMLGHGENSIFEAAMTLNNAYPDLEYKEVIADVRESNRIHRIMQEYKPDVIFHAAAHKHVPLMEENPFEAVKTNIFGTHNVAEAALKNDVGQFVFISTDKAVNPTSVMGVTKRIAEIVILHYSRRSANTSFMSVRFGNVLGSRGSVVPTFKEQIRRGGPVTITHPDMTRYFMTIPEAVHLVLQAGAMGQGGEVFVLDMGKPVRILDMAYHLIRLSGLEPEIDIPIKFTGIRNGEKLYEELLTAEEGTDATLNKRIFKARAQTACLSQYKVYIKQLEQLLLEEKESAKLFVLLKKIVPSYRPSPIHQSLFETAVGKE